MLIESTEYRRIHSDQAPDKKGKWNGMREVVASEAKTKHRFNFAAGVIGLFVGMAGALMLDQIFLTNDSGTVNPDKKASIGQATTVTQAKPPVEDRVVVGDARPAKPERERARPRLHVNADDVNLRAGPSTANSAITKLSRGTELVEIERSTNWVQVEIPSLDGRKGWLHESLVDRSPLETAPENNRSGADEAPHSAGVEVGLASDGTCRGATGGANDSVNCFQRGDNDGAPDKTLDIFQDLIKLKKYDCDGRIDAASYVKKGEKEIFFVQCGETARYSVEIIGDNLKIRPIPVDSTNQALKK